jgi:adenosylmethionine-8-amino-7-oxononanoate aminotransferase
MRQCIRAKNQIHSAACCPPVSDLRGNTVQISPPFISTNDEFRQLMAAIDTVLSAQEAK